MTRLSLDGATSVAPSERKRFEQLNIGAGIVSKLATAAALETRDNVAIETPWPERIDVLALWSIRRSAFADGQRGHNRPDLNIRPAL